MKKIIVCSLMMAATLAVSAQVLDSKKINTTGQKDIKPGELKGPTGPPAKVTFSAVIAEARSAVPAYEDKGMLARFTQLQWNEGNGFDAAKGVFTAPTTGVYCFIGNFNIGKYGCIANPISYSVTVVKNNNQFLDTYIMPVETGSAEAYTTGNITFMLQLNAGDKIALKPQAIACTGGSNPILYKVVFSGYKVN